MVLIIFMFENYYPNGGVGDIEGVCDKDGLIGAIEAAILGSGHNSFDGSIQVYDVEKKESVFDVSKKWTTDYWADKTGTQKRSDIIEEIKIELQKKMNAWH